VGLSYVLDGESGLSLCHHVYQGNVADVEEFSVALARIVRLLDQNQMARDTVTLVFDKGTAALDNTVELEQAGVGWISALPWNQAPQELRERATEELPPCSAEQPGVRAVAEKLLVHGQEYLAVVKYSAPFAAEQLHSLTTSISRALQSLRRFSKELNKPRARWTKEGITRKIEKFLGDVIRYQLESRDGQWRLQFDFEQAAFERLLGRRFGRTVLLTNRLDWTAEQVVAGYAGQQQVERVFRGLKDGEWLGWGPMYHWTDRKIRIHAFYCMLGISLLQYVHRQAKAAWSDLSMEQLIEELQQIQQFILLYPRQGEKGPDRATYVLSKQTLAQQALAKALKLDELQITHRG
jgi:transposase